MKNGFLLLIPLILGLGSIDEVQKTLNSGADINAFDQEGINIALYNFDFRQYFSSFGNN